jgi:hypothetical protein
VSSSTSRVLWTIDFELFQIEKLPYHYSQSKSHRRASGELPEPDTWGELASLLRQQLGVLGASDEAERGGFTLPPSLWHFASPKILPFHCRREPALCCNRIHDRCHSSTAGICRALGSIWLGKSERRKKAGYAKYTRRDPMCIRYRKFLQETFEDSGWSNSKFSKS